MKIYLDDMRHPPEGWTLCTNINEVKDLLRDKLIVDLSLDHDLGACAPCMQVANAGSPEEWLWRSGGSSMPNCPHVGTGYDLVKWMTKTGHWPTNKPTVHSANPVGSKNMREDIERYFGQEAQE